MPRSAEPMTTISVRVPEHMRDQLDALAKSTSRNRQYHAFEAMHRYIEAEKWQVDLIAERKRQVDAGEIEYATPEQVTAARSKRYSAEHTE